jgi:hypothetical protein
VAGLQDRVTPHDAAPTLRHHWHGSPLPSLEHTATLGLIAAAGSTALHLLYSCCSASPSSRPSQGLERAINVSA